MHVNLLAGNTWKESDKDGQKVVGIASAIYCSKDNKWSQCRKAVDIEKQWPLEKRIDSREMRNKLKVWLQLDQRKSFEGSWTVEVNIQLCHGGSQFPSPSSLLLKEHNQAQRHYDGYNQELLACRQTNWNMNHVVKYLFFARAMSLSSTAFTENKCFCCESWVTNYSHTFSEPSSALCLLSWAFFILLSCDCVFYVHKDTVCWMLRYEFKWIINVWFIHWVKIFLKNKHDI